MPRSPLPLVLRGLDIDIMTAPRESAAEKELFRQVLMPHALSVENTLED